MENKIFSALKKTVSDLQSIEAATLSAEESETSVYAYSHVAIEGDLVTFIDSDDTGLFNIHKCAIQNAERSRKITLDLLTGIINKL